MGARNIRDWTDSEAVNSVSANAERLFIRLIMKVDDFGRHDARPMLLRATCFPLVVDDITDGMLEEWLCELVSAGIIGVYHIHGFRFLQINNFRQRARIRCSNYPTPPGGEDPPTAFIPASIRREVLAAGECVVCGATDRLTVDHIIPVTKGGTGERMNLRCLCLSCNSSKGARDA
jgi:hypothetical protein